MQPVPSSSGRPSLDVDVASARPSMDVERPSLELGRETFAMTDSTSTSTSSFGVIIPNRTSTGYGLYASETIPQQQQQQPLQRNGGEYHPEDPRRTPFGTRDRPQPVPASVLSTSTSMPPPGSGSTKQVVLDTVRASRLAASTNSVPPVPNTKRPELDARSSDGSILTRASDVGSVRGRNKVPVPMPTHIGAVPAAAKKNRHTLGAVTRRVVSDQDASELAASNGAASVGRRTVSSRTPVRPPDVRNGPSSVGGGRKVLGVLSDLPTRSRHGSMSAGTFASSIDAASNPRSSFETEGRPSLDSNTSSIPPSTTESSVPPDPTHRRHSSVFALGYNGRPNVASGGGHQRSPSYPNAHPQPQTASAVRRPSASGEGTRYTPSPTPTSATRVDHQAAFMAWRDGRGNDATWHGPRSVVGRQSTGASTGTLPWSPTSSASTSSANARSPLVQSTEVMRLMDDMQTLREKHARETEALLGALSDAQRASRAAKEDTGAIERAFGRLRDEKDALVVERDELVRMLGDYEAELAPLQDISARYDVLENEHIGLRHAHAELESAHEQMASGYDELVRVHQDLARRFEEIGGRVGRAGTQLVEENEALREEVDRLRAELQQFQEEEDQAEDLADAQAAARALREENALLRSRVREAEGRERMLQQRVDELAPPAHASPRGQASRSSLTSHSSYPSSVGHVQVQTARLDPHHSADRRSVAMPQPRHGRIVHGQPVTHNPPSLGGSPSSYSQSASRDIAPPISPSPSGSSEKENVPQSRSVRIPARGRDPTTSFLATARDAHQHGAAAPQAFHPHHTFGTYSMSNGGQAGEVTESSFNFPPEAEALNVSEGDVFGDASPRALLTARDHCSHPSPGVVLGRASAARGSYASPDALSLHRPLPTPPLQHLSGQESARLSASTNTT
ncbi:hypothetical protein BKA62DRAFT_695633 [Auriculariales sp. MPI-PUGE-AT-0066]|nr:hypothetical protein BKA62DRAFT_695633 [Auriculariales sp. MPI-PUGE-AT-0066]